MMPATGAGRAPDHASGIMAKVEIYTSIMCPYCSRAVGLLQSKNIAFEQIDVSMSGALRQTMRSRAGGRTSVPQIFIDNEHIGGCDDLIALESAGHLDALLNRPAP
jgi:glutaredoxin 3